MALPNLKEIEWAISELENEESSKSGYLLLSALYHLRDRMSGSGESSQASGYARSAGPLAEPAGLYGESDFLRAVATKDSAAAWAVMDELMETLQVVKPRAYASVMRKLHNL
ncbi:MAG: hypothetical protein K2P33_06080 [Acutalibacter sp.]|nr:hypothetical protein [Acutalibacter sp.]